MNVSIAHVAKLAQLELSEEELGKLEKDFQNILAFVDTLNAATASSEPLSSTISGVSHVVRDDVSTPSTLADALMTVAPDRRDRFARVANIQESHHE